MQLKSAPRGNPRYWTAILLASMCGTNLGDFFPRVLHVGSGPELITLAILFAAIMLVDRLSPRGGEALYWTTILVVRAAATAIADFSIEKACLGFVGVGGALAVLMAFLLIFNDVAKPSKTGLPSANGVYWFTMLTAGTLGTIIGDGLMRAFPTPEIDVLISVASATALLAAMLGLRGKEAHALGASYWIAIVGVRWWGTNMGDVLGFLAGLASSMAVTAAAMAVQLLVWQNQAEPQMGGAP